MPPKRGAMPRLELAGLASQWEKCEVVRRKVIWDGALLVWPVGKVGQASYTRARDNFDALSILFEKVVAMVPAPRSVAIADISVEAGFAFKVED